MSYAPAADSVLQILLLLARQATPVPAGLISATLGLPRSTTYRLLGVLVEQGLAVYLPEERRYGVGVVAYEIGSAYQRQVPLRRVAQPILSRLVLQTRENAHLAVLHGQDVYYVIEERAPRRSPLVSDVGVRLPATVTASGLAILAGLSNKQVRAVFPHPRDLVQRDGHGPGTLTELRRMLVDVRRHGYSYEEGLVTPDVSSVGVAVRDHTGYPVAAIAITYQTARISAGQRRRLAAAATRAAETLADRLTH